MGSPEDSSASRKSCDWSVSKDTARKSETLSDLQLNCSTGSQASPAKKWRLKPGESLCRHARAGAQAASWTPELPDHLPRVEQVVACKDRTCQQCGGETTLIGYDESEHLDMEPARFFVRVVKREKRGCRQCKTVAW